MLVKKKQITVSKLLVGVEISRRTYQFAHSFDNALSDTKDTAPTIFGYLWHSNVDDSWLVAVSKDRQFVKYVVPVLYQSPSPSMSSSLAQYRHF